MPSKQPYRYANQLLAQLVPAEVLRKARELALQYRREEFIRAFLLKRVLLILLITFLLIIFGIRWIGALLSFLKPYWILHTILVGTLLVVVLSLPFLVYLLFSRLERQAAKLTADSIDREDNGSSKPS